MKFLTEHNLILNNTLCRQFKSFQMSWWQIKGDKGRNWSCVGALKRGIIICAVKVLSTNKNPTWDACGYQLSKPSKGPTLGPISATPHTTMPHPHLLCLVCQSPLVSTNWIRRPTYLKLSPGHASYTRRPLKIKKSHTTNPTTVSYPRKPESLAILLWIPRILQTCLTLTNPLSQR